MARINKNNIIDYVSEEAYLSRKDAKSAVESMIEIIIEALKAGDEVDIPNFGSFNVKERKAKMITHPATQKKELSPSHNVVTFRMSKNLKEKINGK